MDVPSFFKKFIMQGNLVVKNEVAPREIDLVANFVILSE